MTPATTLPVLCWEAPAVLDVIPVEAESPLDGVFTATHSKLAIERRSNLDQPGGERVEEDDVLAALEKQPADLPIIPILGNSGTGKSHLVRWLRLQLRDMSPSKPDRRVIFVPKHKMSLRAILDLILDEASGASADEYRQRVREATDKLDNENDARNRLRAVLSYLIAESPRDPSHLNAADKDEREYLASELPSLLDDPVFKTRILADDGALARLSKEKFSGKSAEDKEEPFAFKADDLRLTVDDTNNASAAARDIADVLGGDALLRELAAKMLNEQLSPAVSSVFGVGGDDLKNLLIDLRLDLAKSGEELLLLIEDFSIFQGVQGGLIDAMTQVPTAAMPLCPMRVVMAVTTGYFADQVPDTAKTRTYCAFDLDVKGSASSTDLPSFVAPYLNAVRVGAETLERSFAAREELPNKCETCPVADPCHTAFGSSAGIGLYPFNPVSLERAMRSQQATGDIFVARNVLKDVVRPVLKDDRDAIAESRFPAPDFAQRFPTHVLDIDWSVEETAQIRGPGESDEQVNRRRRLLTYFAPSPVPQNLNSYIHESFGIPQIDGLPDSVDVHVPNTTKPHTKNRREQTQHDNERIDPPEQSTRKHNDPQLVQAVDSWSRGEPLRQGHQNELRKLIYNAVVSTLDFEDSLGGPANWAASSTERGLSGGPIFRPTSVFFQGTKQLDVSGIRLDIARDDINAVRSLRALAFLNSGRTWVDLDRGAELQRLTTRQVATWVRDIEQQFYVPRDDMNAVDPEVGYLASALLLSGQILGIESSFAPRNSVNILDAMFIAAGADFEDLPRPIKILREGAIELKGKCDRETLQKLLLRRTSYSQGTGATAAVDSARILRSLRDDARRETVPAELSPDVVDFVTRMDALNQRLDSLRPPVEAVLPDTSTVGSNVKEIVKSIEKTLRSLQAFDMVPASIDVTDVNRLGQGVDASDVQRVNKLHASLSNWDNLTNSDRLLALSGDWPSSAAKLTPWIARVTKTLDLVQSTVESKIDPQLAKESTAAHDALTAELTAALLAVGKIASPESAS
ncbi:protein DpdH [Mycolicibacterium mucogenicum]|uniref:protein DpdH n=1 Tax=Mycolicibacterium mucogenicum TaxID=56689 RepID=UPI00226A69C2|nr:protein DpdH [Mycolicibacterium mucogenicum]MCX8557524.1 protein DpdH [Mycolicibacterium mucogenicum]